MIPPEIEAAYQRGNVTIRQARTQRERDDDAKKTVLQAGEFLRRIEALLGDPKIHPASADLARWYAEEIAEARKSRNGRRLAELAAEFADDSAARAFRRIHWWQGAAVAISAGDDDGQGDDDGYAVLDGEIAEEDEPEAIEAPPPARQPRRRTLAEALAAYGWRLATAPDGRCQVLDARGQRCAGGTGRPPISDALGRGAWFCETHYIAVDKTMNGTSGRNA